MGMDKNKLRCRQHLDNERSFYSSDTWDIEFVSDVFGVVELVGVADRTDYDLKRHMDLSKQDFSVDIDGKKVVPHTIEVAFGIDRPLYCIMESCQKEVEGRRHGLISWSDRYSLGPGQGRANNNGSFKSDP